MTSTPVVRLAGIDIGGSNAYEWPLTTGVMPHERIFTVTERIAEQLRAVSQGVSSTSPGVRYEVAPDGKPHLVVERLFIADIFPGATTHTRRVRVVDARWLTQFDYVSQTFNERRVTGDVNLTAEGANPEIPELDPEIRYAKYSLRDESEPWKGSEVLAEVMGDLFGASGWRYSDPRISTRFDQTPVDDLVLDDPGHFALERVLAYFTGATIYMDRQGHAVVVDSLDGSEQGVYEQHKDSQQRQVSVRVADRRNIRPSKVVVLFTPELEVRFDYQEPSSSGTRTAPDTDTNAMDNVAVMPDPLGLKVHEAGRAPRYVGPGTYVRLDDLFTAYGDGPGHGAGGVVRPLSWDILRKHRASFFRYSNAEFSVKNKDTNLVDIPWSRRIAQIEQSYRKDFQIREVFMQRLASIRPVRAAMISPVTGHRASSPVYADYIRRPSIQGLAAARVGALHGTQVQGYAAKLADAKAAPARVRVLNPGAGVIRIDPVKGDPNGYSTETMFGYSSEGIPKQTKGFPGWSEATHFWGLWDRVKLDAQWQMSTILSCVPASPNSKGRLLAVEIKPDELHDVLGRDPGECWGPTAYVRVFPGLVTARYAWDDDKAKQIVAAVKGEGGQDDNGGGLYPEGLLVNADHIRDVAKAAAARLYAGVLDRPFGTLEVDMQPSLEPTGAISEVSHVMQGGATRTLIRFGTVATPRDVWRFLPAATRRVLLRSLQSVSDAGTGSLGGV